MSGVGRKMLQASGAFGGEPYWINVIGGSSIDQLLGVITNSEGTSFAVGSTVSVGSGGTDGLIVSYSPSGTSQWTRTLGGANTDVIRAAHIDSSGSLVVAGETTSEGEGGRDAIVAKYSSAGVLQWAKRLGGSGSIDSAYSVVVDSVNNVIIGGVTNSDGAGLNDFFLAKYNSVGALQWDRTLGGSANDEGRAIAVDSSDNIIVVGSGSSDWAGGQDAIIAKYNSAGTRLWTKTLGGSQNEAARAVTTDMAGNIYISGYTSSSGAGDADILLAKYNPSGVLQWSRAIGGLDFDICRAMTLDSSGNIVLCGRTNSDGLGSGDMFVSKHSSNGVLLWANTLGGTFTDDGFGVSVDGNENIFVSGWTQSEGAGGQDAILAKLPPDGSGTGVYGNLTYAPAVFSDSAVSLTSATAVLTDAPAVLVSGTSSLVDAPAVLSDEFFRIRP